jgi:hypothetical protein
MEETTTEQDTRKELLLKVQQILASIDEWKLLWYHADRRYAELLRYFNGGDLRVIVDDSKTEVAEYANFNVARSRLLKIDRERMAPWFSKLGIFDVKLVKPELKAVPGLEIALNETMSKMLRKDGRMTPHYRSTNQDAILTGRGVQWRRMPTQLVWERGRMLCHTDAICAVKDDTLGEWAFASRVVAKDLFKIAKASKDEAIRGQARNLLKSIADRHHTEATPINFPSESELWEVFDETLRTTSYGRKALATSVPCYWYFEKDYSGPPGERPVSVYCVARHGMDLQMVHGDDNKVSVKEVREPYHAEGMIYRQEKAFNSVTECLAMMTIGEQFGGDPTMGRLKGEGEIQYTGDVRIQTMLNSMLSRVEMENMPLFKDNGAADKKRLDALASRPLRPYDVIPEGVDFLERRFGDKPLSGMLDVIALLSGHAADHAAVDTGHTDSPREENFKDQVLERLNDRASAKSIAETSWADAIDPVAESIGRLIFDETLVRDDEAWEFRELFFELLEDRGFKYTHQDFKDGVRVTAREMPGHGDMGIALARADVNIGLAQMTGPEAVKRAVFEKAVLVAGGDVQKAAALLGGMPGAPQGDMDPDVMMAQSQTSVILSSGVQLAPGPEDNPAIHAAVHMTILEGALAAYQQDGGWSPDNLRKWDAALAHAIADVVRIPLEDAKKASIQRIKALQTTAGSLPVFATGEPPVDPIQQAKIELAAAELERKRRKDETADAKWERTQAQREEMGQRQMALQEFQTVSSTSRAERELASKAGSRTLNDAIALNTATQPEPAASTAA